MENGWTLNIQQTSLLRRQQMVCSDSSSTELKKKKTDGEVLLNGLIFTRFNLVDFHNLLG